MPKNKTCRICGKTFTAVTNRNRLCSSECSIAYDHLSYADKWILRSKPKPVSREARMYSQMMARPDGFGPWHDPG